MKIFQSIIFACIVSLVFFGCGSASTSVKSNEENTQFIGTEDPDPTITLSEHLKRLPGVMVRGSGNSATITIRGVNSLTGSNEPLFIVNGQELQGGYASISSMITVHDIKSIRVLKDPVDTALYGYRGANGVIEIKLKK